jgi:hypothetical protein
MMHLKKTGRNVEKSAGTDGYQPANGQSPLPDEAKNRPNPPQRVASGSEASGEW